MSSSTIIAGPLANLEDNALKGVRRSRFSMHLKTRKVRRWLLVQLVSMPADGTQETEEPAFVRPAPEQELAQSRTNLGNLVDEFRLTRPTQNWT